MQPSHPPTSPPPSQPPGTLAFAPPTLTTAPPLPLPPESPAIEAAAHYAACLFSAFHAARARGEDADEELWDEAMEYFEEARAHVHTIHDPGWRSRVEAVLAELPFPGVSASPQPLA